MNIHVSEKLRDKWIQYEFVGVPIRRANGKTYMRAKYKHWPWQGETHIYCFDDDIFWHATSLQDVP